MRTHTFWVPVTILIGSPQPSPGEHSGQTQWVRVEVPAGELATSGRPSIDVPAFIPHKGAVYVKIGGQPRNVSAAVARGLAELAAGAQRVALRPECAAKFAREVPEVVLRRDSSRKLLGKRVWYVRA